jgi:hypothetical protein
VNEVRFEILSTADSRWASFLGRTRHDVYHLPAYVDMCARSAGGHAAALHVARADAELLLPLVIRPLPDFGTDALLGWRDAISPYGYPGPVLANASANTEGREPFVRDALLAIVEGMREHQIVTAFVRLHPLLDTPTEPFARHGKLIHHGDTISIDLSQAEDQIWSKLRRNHQRDIEKLLQRSDVRVEMDDGWKRLPEFIEAYHSTMDRVGADRSYYFDRSYFEALRGALGRRAHLIAALVDGRLAGGGIFTECCGIVQYHLGATLDEFLELRPQKLVYRHAWLWAKASGHELLHLGGGVGGHEDSLFHFKSGFSDRRHPFFTWRVCSEPAVYQRTIDAWKKQNQPDLQTGDFFPPYRQTMQLQGSR